MGERDWMTLLDRELYWREEPAADPALAAADLRLRADRLAETLQADLGRGVPARDPDLTTGSRWRRAAKRVLARLFRPVSRRADRMTAELAAISSSLVDLTSQVHQVLARLEAEVTLLHGRAGPAAPAPAPPLSTRWLFEPEEERAGRLARYEPHAAALLARAGRAPLWVDLGSGRGELLALVGSWGWRTVGVETAGPAADRAAGLGLPVVRSDAAGYLQGYDGEPPTVVSALGLLEHLPVDRWEGLLRAAGRAIAAGGGVLVEVWDPADPEGARRLRTDPTVLQPAAPEAVERLAAACGLTDVERLGTADGAAALWFPV